MNSVTTERGPSKAMIISGVVVVLIILGVIYYAMTKETETTLQDEGFTDDEFMMESPSDPLVVGETMLEGEVIDDGVGLEAR